MYAPKNGKMGECAPKVSQKNESRKMSHSSQIALETSMHAPTKKKRAGDAHQK